MLSVSLSLHFSSDKLAKLRLSVAIIPQKGSGCLKSIQF